MGNVQMNGNTESTLIETLTAHGDHYVRQTFNVVNNIVVLTLSHKNNPVQFVHYIQSSKSHWPLISTRMEISGFTHMRQRQQMKSFINMNCTHCITICSTNLKS